MKASNTLWKERLAGKLSGIKGRPSLVWPERERKSWLADLLESNSRSLIRAFKKELAPSGAQYLYIPRGPRP